MTIKNIKNINELVKLIKNECITCNLKSKKLRKNVCTNCIFSPGNKTKSNFFKFGMITISKHKFLYLLNHPELEWKFPPIPDYDSLGNHKSTKKFRWVIHHKDTNHWNDKVENTVLCLNTEHRSIHNKIFNPMTDPKISKKAAIAIKNTRLKEVRNKTHNFITNHPMKNIKIAKRCGETRKNREKLGFYKYRTKNQLRIRKWLNDLNFGKHKLTKELSLIFGYKIGCTSNIKKLIERVIIKDNLNNFKFVNISRSNYILVKLDNYK